jgi:hypothetical protein
VANQPLDVRCIITCQWSEANIHVESPLPL